MVGIRCMQSSSSSAAACLMNLLFNTAWSGFKVHIDFKHIHVLGFKHIYTPLLFCYFDFKHFSN